MLRCALPTRAHILTQHYPGAISLLSPCSYFHSKAVMK
nr:MAG TPA: hypothetical protein [Caudoviricetes sp.]